MVTRVVFPEDNSLPYSQDFREEQGIPAAVVWLVEVDESGPTPRYRLIADGYGFGIPARPPGQYGNGALHVTAEVLDLAQVVAEQQEGHDADHKDHP